MGQATPRVFYSQPYDCDKNIGAYYNAFMEILPDDEDFACFTDGDTMFTTSDYGTQIADIIKAYPGIGCFVALTNRIHCSWQVLQRVDYENNDMAYHRARGLAQQQQYYSKCIDVTHNKPRLSGFLILLKKSAWKRAGMFNPKGMLKVDNEFHQQCASAGVRVCLMLGVYLYHWYRWPDPEDAAHLL